ncbi:MAG: hypothetical protein Q4E64_09280 [Phascolarctobacterium sp.]|uniref:hypothetical protein n=1 Tax=Phascolarctobacterium sp. TaxID=2049039 RepID=UPI0026DDB13D|nr:hypothetical protein [Phascolarctobacterium sp.]MDO4921999.1 hypothetical protein [Phascolarctobacterium sp.]
MKYAQQLWSIRWPLAYLLSLGLLLGLWQQAVEPGLAEYAALQRETEQQRQELERLKSLAADQDGYEAGIARQAAELAALKSRLQAAGDINAVQNAVQRLAVDSGVQLLEISASAAVNAADGVQRQNKLHRLQVQAEGDYYAVLRWLRQLERQGTAVDELRLQGEGSAGRVRAGLMLKVYGAGELPDGV